MSFETPPWPHAHANKHECHSNSQNASTFFPCTDTKIPAEISRFRRPNCVPSALLCQSGLFQKGQRRSLRKETPSPHRGSRWQPCAICREFTCNEQTEGRTTTSRSDGLDVEYAKGAGQNAVTAAVSESATADLITMS